MFLCIVASLIIIIIVISSILRGIRPSVDGLCRDGPSEISRDPRTKQLKTQPKG